MSQVDPYYTEVRMFSSVQKVIKDTLENWCLVNGSNCLFCYVHPTDQGGIEE